VTVENEGKMVEVKIVEIVDPFGGFGPSGVNGNPSLFLLIIVLRPGVENVGLGIGRLYFGVIGVGKTFNFAGRDAFGPGQGDEKIGEFGAEAEVGILNGKKSSLAFAVVDLLIAVV